jgi:hypothetical protein
MEVLLPDPLLSHEERYENELSMNQTLTPERTKQIFSRLDDVLKRFKFLSGGTDPDVVVRGDNWLRDAQTRAVISKLDGSLERQAEKIEMLGYS